MLGWIKRLFAHECSTPPEILMGIIARIGNDSIWEQRLCPRCKRVTHWRRDSVNEPFEIWRASPLSDFPVQVDLRRSR